MFLFKFKKKSSNEPNKKSLVSFIVSISHPKNKHTDPWPTPKRDMVDLCDMVKKYYYNPHTFGSNSIKAVLPAILKSSKVVQEKYSQAISEIAVSSQNFDSNQAYPYYKFLLRLFS